MNKSTATLPYTVFLVEDSAMIRDRLRRLIDAEPALAVIGTANGTGAAVRELRTLNPDAIVIDIALQEGDGFEVLENVNQMKPKPLIIMLTNYTYVSYRVRGLSEGAHYFFDKSTEFDSVISVLRKHADERAKDVTH
jgi:DNA-binding NarL/FixJ family response regulator